MYKITINVSNLTNHYVLKKNGYNRNLFHRDFDVSDNKPVFCNCVNIVYCNILQLVLQCGPYYVDSFEKGDVNISFICEDIKEKVKNLLCWRQKQYISIQEMSATMVHHLVKTFFTITLQQIVILTQIFF